MNTEMQKQARAARDAHMALLDLKKLVDEATQTTHTVELEAVHLACSTKETGDVSPTIRALLERLGSSDFEASLNKARQSLQTAIS
jgi:hypothetical protein